MAAYDGNTQSLPALVEQARGGDHASWTAIVDGLNGLVWSVVRGFRLDYDDAEEVGQTTWLKLLENLDRIHDPERLGLWLATTARREAIRMLDKKSRTRTVEPSDWRLEQPQTESGHGQVLDREELQDLPHALSAMTPQCQELLHLLLCDPPFSYLEISEVLELPIGTIGPRRYRCLSKLRTLL